MNTIAVLFAIICVISAVFASTEDECPISRPAMIKCAALHLDTNRNSKLERSELESAISSLPWYASSFLKVLGSVDMIMKKCDYNGDGAIDMKKGGDMDKSSETCLKSCFKRKAFKSAFFPDCGNEEL